MLVEAFLLILVSHQASIMSSPRSYKGSIPCHTPLLGKEERVRSSKELKEVVLSLQLKFQWACQSHTTGMHYSIRTSEQGY